MMAHESHLAEFSSSGHHPAMQGFDPPGHELFSLQAGMEMLGFPSKQQREFLPRDFSQIHDKNMMVATEISAISPWQVDDAASRPLFPSTGGLSLSLSNARASNTYGFPQSFQQNDIRDGLLSRAPNSHQEHLLNQEGRGFYSQQYTYQLKNSKYLIPVQELLSELCSLGRGESSSKTHKGNQVGSSSSSSWNQSLSSMNILELQKRKADLFTMLTEVDKRYRKYCQQMKAVVSSFEAVAGGGAAAIYSKLASRAMSRHFRCLRDAITGQIRETKNVLGVKDTGATGATRGETPRLKLLDQCLRQQRAFQQTGMTESHPWRPQRGLPERAVSILRAWLFEHFLHPYPSDVDKHILARQTGLSRSQVSNWFINARVRLWKPMIEEMYSEETKDQDNHSGRQGSTNKNPNPNSNPVLDKKPTPPQLSANCDSLSSIVNSGSKNIHSVPRADNFSAVADMDFSSYRTTYGDQNLGSGFLSLGLQQHGGGGMSLSYAPPTQNSFLVSGEHLDSSQPTQFSILDGEEQTLPYRNLMGVQLLHDLAG